MSIDNRLQALMRKLGSTAPLAWLLARFGYRLDRFFLRHFHKSLLGILTGLPIVTLTTTGAKSGTRRTQPLVAIRDAQQPQQVAFIASNWGQGKRPAWYYNLKANPQATITENGRTQEYIAREASGAEYDHYWQLAVRKYAGYNNYKARLNGRHIPIMILEPENE